jgi:hypothetical protein
VSKEPGSATDKRTPVLDSQKLLPKTIV